MYLDSAISSLIDTADNPDLVDFWVRYDNDDELTKEYVKTDPFNIRKVKFYPAQDQTIYIQSSTI